MHRVTNTQTDIPANKYTGTYKNRYTHAFEMSHSLLTDKADLGTEYRSRNAHYMSRRGRAQPHPKTALKVQRSRGWGWIPSRAALAL